MKAISISLVLALAAHAVAQAQYGGGTGIDDGLLTLRATTPAEGYSRGIADLVRSGGLYNLRTSEAALKAAEAREYEMGNATQAISTYFQIRQLNREYRAAKRRPRPSKEDLARYSRARGPKPLGPSELDTVTGRLSWPVLLRAKEHARYRTQLARLFTHRALVADISTEDYLKIHRFTSAMKTDLKQRIRQVPPEDYIRATKFLDSLVYEARKPMALRPDLAMQR